jgi:uncharacterized YigZ family protein
MLFDHTYRTIKAPCEGIFRDKGSKFIAYGFPIKTEESVKSHLSNLREEHPKASHYCWALRLTPDRTVYRTNDDGEPSGTAGRPILNILLSMDVTNILIVVVRYFGGTLLGVPGLINAYKTATQEVLKAASIVELTINDHYQMHFQYPQINAVMQIIKDHQLTILNQKLENECQLEVEIPKSTLNTIVFKLEKIPGLSLSYLRTL